MRLATLDDIPFMVDMGRKFHAYSQWVQYAEYCPHRTAQMLQGLIESDEGFAAVKHDGLICGCLAAMPYLKDFIVAHEMFWWSASNGMDLLRMFEAWAQEKGASAIAVSHAVARRGKALERVFVRNGYTPNEAYYIRRL